MPEISRLASDVLAQSWKEFVWQWSAIFSQNDEHYFDVKDKSDSRANKKIIKSALNTLMTMMMTGIAG